jgi:hypothetical protein
MAWRAIAAVLVLVLWPTLAVAAGVFDVNGRPPLMGVVTISAEAPGPDPGSAMLDELQGVLARLDRKECVALRAAGSGPVVDEPDGGLSLMCHVHVSNGADSRRVEVLRDAAGAYYARGPETTAGRVVLLNALKFANVAVRWPLYRAEGLQRLTPGQAGVLEPPYTPGVFRLDREALGDRLLGGRSTSLKGTERLLGMNPLHVRLPRGFDPRQPCGLLVYIDPGAVSKAHEFMHQAADELGLVIVAPERVGNGVYAPDRWQAALDAVATVSARVRIDPRRVYITGISGGGQIATHMCLCFPEVFAGAVPIVALGSYENIPIGNGTMWQGTFGKPRREVFTLAKERRLCAITGGRDFNRRVVREGARILTRDGISIRVNDYEDMGHEAPSPERFAEALRWVDEPSRTRRATDVAAAESLLKSALENGSGEEGRASLVQVTRVAPWSPAAWRAAELLGLSARK